MGLYNMLFGRNPVSDVILATLNLSPKDVGRFRDAYVANGEIAVYTRNGGGNRECWHVASSEDEGWYASEHCKHVSRVVKVAETVEATTEEAAQHPEWKPTNVYIGMKRMYDTGNKVDETQYKCLGPDSESCFCPGCIIEHRLPKHPLYLRDEDDDFDPTYATIYFRFPEEYADELRALDSGEQPKPSEKWDKLFEVLDKLKEQK